MSALNAGTARGRGGWGWVPRWIFSFAGRRPGQPGAGDVGERLEDILGQIGKNKPSLGWQIPLIIAVVVALLIFRPYVVIDNGQGGVVFSKVSGVADQPLEPGFHLIVPVLHSVSTYDTKVRTYKMSEVRGEGAVQGDDALVVLTSDGQIVTLDVTVRYALPVDSLPDLHQEVGPLFVNRIIRPQSRSVVRMICAQHPVQDFTSEARDEIRSEIVASLGSKFTESYIDLEDVILENVQFSQEFQVAVEEKQQALQDALQMVYAIQESEGEAQRVVTEAQGDAEAIKARGEALQKNPLLVQYEYIGKIAPNVGGLILTPDKVDQIAAPGEVSTPPVPVIRTEMDEVFDLDAASPAELAAQLEADLQADIESEQQQLPGELTEDEALALDEDGEDASTGDGDNGAAEASEAEAGTDDASEADGPAEDAEEQEAPSDSGTDEEVE